MKHTNDNKERHWCSDTCLCHKPKSEGEKFCEHDNKHGACEYKNCPFTMFPSEKQDDAQPIIDRCFESYEAGAAHERERILRIVTGLKGTKEHICRFNDGEQSCDCFNAALSDLTAAITSN